MIGKPHVAEFDFAARDGISGSGASAGGAGSGSSSNLKMRSQAAMADCRILNFSLRS